MTELSLFTGAGGGVVASHLIGWRTIGYVEIDDYCQKVLRRRIDDGAIDEAPIFGDITTFNADYAESYRGLVDVISAGFPCQPFSLAGRRRSEDDHRNLWPATMECIRLVRPRYVFLENVPGLATAERLMLMVAEKVRQFSLLGARSADAISRYVIRRYVKATGQAYVGRVFGDLAEGGYDCRWRRVSAAEVGAPHKRGRLWVLAHPTKDVVDTNE